MIIMVDFKAVKELGVMVVDLRVRSYLRTNGTCDDRPTKKELFDNQV